MWSLTSWAPACMDNGEGDITAELDLFHHLGMWRLGHLLGKWIFKRIFFSKIVLPTPLTDHDIYNCPLTCWPLTLMITSPSLTPALWLAPPAWEFLHLFSKYLTLFPRHKKSPTYLDCLHPGGSVPRQGEAIASFISVYYQCPALFSQLELYKDKQQFRREEIGWCQHLVFFRWGLLLTSEMCISIFEPGYGAPHLLSITRHAASPRLASQGESSIPSPPRFTLKIVQKCFRYWITPKINVGSDCMVRVFQIIDDDHPLLFVLTSPRIIWLSQNVSFKAQLAEVFEQSCTIANH